MQSLVTVGHPKIWSYLMQSGVGEASRGGRAAAAPRRDGDARGGGGGRVRVHHVRLDLREPVAADAAAAAAHGDRRVAHRVTHGGGVVLQEKKGM